MYENIGAHAYELSADELKEKLAEITELYDEVLEEREMMLGQSGHHIPSTRLFNDYRDEIQRISDDISLVKALLCDKHS